jgi:hypothetical protein
MTEAGNIYGRGISFPPRIDANGRVAWSEGTQNIRESIKIILLTELGERLMLSEFGAGLKNFLYEPNTVETRRLIEEQITHALNQWEPRIQLQEVNVEEDTNDSQQAIATITYKLTATQQVIGVSVQVKLGG